jgi:hypothetical protein
VLNKLFGFFWNNRAASVVALCAGVLGQLLSKLSEHAVYAWLLDRIQGSFVGQEASLIASAASYLPGIITAAIVFIVVFLISRRARAPRGEPAHPHNPPAPINTQVQHRTRPITYAAVPEVFNANSSQFMSLYEAAQRLVDEQIGVYDSVSRTLSRDPVLWWCAWIRGNFQLYGRFAPARVMRPFPSDGYNLEREGDSVYGIQKYGDGRWVDLSIMTTDFPILLSLAKNRAGQMSQRRPDPGS